MDRFREGGDSGSDGPRTSCSVIYVGRVIGISGEVVLVALATSSAALATLVAARNRRLSNNGNPHPHLVHFLSMCC